MKMLMWFKFRPAHKHVYDSIYGVEQYGKVTVLECACGRARVFSPKHCYGSFDRIRGPVAEAR